MNFGDFHEKLVETQRRIQAIPDVLAEVIEQEKDEILSLRKDEILLGRDSDGEPFMSYSSDPWFNTEEAQKQGWTAVKYGDYKHRVQGVHDERIEHVLGYPNKGDDIPNLRFTLKRWRPGENFQDSMFINTSRDMTEIGSTYVDADDIDNKYNNKVYGLGPEAKAYFWKWILFPALYDHLWK